MRSGPELTPAKVKKGIDRINERGGFNKIPQNLINLKLKPRNVFFAYFIKIWGYRNNLRRISSESPISYAEQMGFFYRICKKSDHVFCNDVLRSNQERCEITEILYHLVFLTSSIGPEKLLCSLTHVNLHTFFIYVNAKIC